jgi:hypothetical protein
MVVGVCTIAIHLPLARSLKDKRQVLKSLKDRLRRHNISLAEVDGQDVWQRSVLGMAAVAASQPPLERLFESILAEVESSIPGDILQHSVDYADYA